MVRPLVAENLLFNYFSIFKGLSCYRKKCWNVPVESFRDRICIWLVKRNRRRALITVLPASPSGNGNLQD